MKIFKFTIINYEDLRKTLMHSDKNPGVDILVILVCQEQNIATSGHT